MPDSLEAAHPMAAGQGRPAGLVGSVSSAGAERTDRLDTGAQEPAGPGDADAEKANLLDSGAERTNPLDTGAETAAALNTTAEQAGPLETAGEEVDPEDAATTIAPVDAAAPSATEPEEATGSESRTTATAEGLDAADPSARAAAYERLTRRLEGAPTRLAEHLRSGLTDPHPRVRRRAVLAAATARRVPLHPLLAPLRSDPDPQVRRVVREVLRHAPPAERRPDDQSERDKAPTAPLPSEVPGDA